MASNDKYVYTLNYKEQSVLQKQLKTITSQSLHTKYSNEDLVSLALFLYNESKNRLKDLFSFLSGIKEETCAYVYVNGFKEAIDQSQSNLQILKGKILSLIIAKSLGEPFQYNQQYSGEIVAEITPRMGYENTNSGLGVNFFGWHTDDRILESEFRTELISLFGIYNEMGTQTFLANIDDIVTNISGKMLDILMGNNYKIKMPTSFGLNYEIWSNPTSLIWNNNKGIKEVGVAMYHVKPANDQDVDAINALNEFNKAIEQCKLGIVIESGSLLIFNNNRVLHARDTIMGKRLLLRTYIRKNLQALREVTKSNGHLFNVSNLLGIG